MLKWAPAFLLLLASLSLAAVPDVPNMTVRPKAGPVEFFPEASVKPGMKGVAWTVFSGTEPEAVPVEIIGVWRNAWGPDQNIILAKLGGKVQRTNVAGGMSGSPVYIDGKLVGAISLRISVFSPDAICGITPIALMAEINEFDKNRPNDSRTPDKVQAKASLELPGDLARVVAAGSGQTMPSKVPVISPIATPITFSGFTDQALQQFSPIFDRLGMTAVQGGASGSLNSPVPAKNWQNALQPGEAVTAVLVSGAMNMTALGSVTYNDGKRVLAFGHPMFNLGPVDMPISSGEILMTLSSQFQPNKFGNATEIVGALKQDRHSGIMGELGATATMIPVTLKVRSFNVDDSIRKTQEIHFNVIQQQKWTPYLMMATLFNSVSNLNDFSEEETYRMTGELELDGQQRVQVSTMQAPAEMPVPTPMLLAGWWGDKFNRLFLNAVSTPKLKAVNATIDLIPERRVATIESAWIANNKVDAGTELPVRVFLRPYRGERIEKQVSIKIPAGLPRGEHRVLFSDANTLNQLQNIAGSLNQFIDLPQTVAILNQERSNNRLYVSLIEPRPTVYSDDKVMPSLPGSVLNVMQSGRTSNRPLLSSPESAVEQASIPFDVVVNGNYYLKIFVN